ncbi:DUF1697 domain-containing protein [Sphingobacterium tabacisoli]|uniref:DUF1697 domain-containing protein n=1 Tax=Sphingobacterium tabacisoli TaxID=2044855 RepID=A0ABW5L3K8_9SPHI|nr:DUF1697 domain-containing protein [Sphingobacterium tabacisoli]
MTTTYISILRGINVSGQRLIKMEALKKMYEQLSFENVQTYVQSGNVLFSAKNRDSGELASIISSNIQTEFGFDVPVIVMNLDRLEKIIANNPFIKDTDKDEAFLHVTFLTEVLTEFDEGSIIEKKHSDEEVAFTADAVYLYCPNGYGKTKVNNNFLEKKLKMPATTRNWKTVNELLKLATK